MADEEEKKRRQELASRLARWSPETKTAGRPAQDKAKTVSFLDASKKEDSGNGGQAGMDRHVARRKWPPKRIAAYAAGALFVLAVGHELIFGDHSTRLNVQTERITISEVHRGPFMEFIPLRGTVEPIQTIFLDAQESGRVEEVYLEAGAMVEKGEPILKLANPDLELRVMDQEGLFYEQLNNFEQTRIQLNTQSITRQQQLLQMEQDVRRQLQDFELHKELLSRGIISQRQFELKRDDYNYWLKRLEFMQQTVSQDSLARAAQLAQIETAQERLQLNMEAARRNLENLTLRAPVSGQLTSLNADIGQLKAKGERFGQVDVIDSFKVTAEIDEFYITRISQGQTGTFTLSGREGGLVIRRVYPEVLDGRFEVDMNFTATPPDDIRRGQTLQIRLALGDLAEALLIERGGFYQATGGNWVFVVEGDEAVRRDIRIGRQSPEYFEVLEGLQPGERVVTSSYENYEEIDRLVLK